MMKKILLTLSLLSTLHGGQAAQIPQAAKEDARVKNVAFQENNVVRFPARTFIATQILFSPQESVLAVEGGDTAGWMVTYHDNLPNMIFVKPTLLDSKTNMTVVTTKHSYYFQVMSNKTVDEKSASPIYALKFSYPEEERAKVEKLRHEALLRNEYLRKQHKDPARLNWNYRFSGNKQIMPLHVYDDGHFTYFEFSENQPIPAIFAVEDKQGKEAIINTRSQGHVLVVQRIAPQFTLRQGGLVASVFNSNEIARIQQARR